MNKLKNTFCNPIVLPDYPLLPAKRRGMNPLSSNAWNREGKVFTSDREFIRAKYPDYHGGLMDDWHGHAGLGTGVSDRGFGVPNSGGTSGSDSEKKRPPVNFSLFGAFGCTPENDVRATADPSCCYFDGKWYLYCTSGVVYDSDDFIHWTPHPDETWKPISTPMAPTVEKFRGKYYATGNNVPLHVADSPLGPWRIVDDWQLLDGRYITCGDPMIFADDDDRLYLYWGLGAGILGVELDPKNPNKFLTEPKVLILFNPENWWERMGANNEGWQTGCIEGSWMYKRNGKYYLTYSCCGTEYYTYTMGAYVSDKPLDGFKLQEKNPISRSRDGFIKGGGHGSIVNGPNDTIWCFYTIPVCIDHTLERRIGIDPCGIDEDGNLYAITGCELPQYAPGVLAHPEKGNATDVDVLTVFKPSKASSYAPGHKPFYALDETMHTWWQPADNDQEPELAVSLSGSYYLSAVRLMWKDVGLDFDKGIYPGPYQYVVECAESLASDEWKVIVDAADNKEDLAVDYRTFEPVRAAKVRIRILGWQEGIQPGIINFTVFGQSSVKATGEYYKFG